MRRGEGTYIDTYENTPRSTTNSEEGGMVGERERDSDTTGVILGAMRLCAVLVRYRIPPYIRSFQGHWVSFGLHFSLSAAAAYGNITWIFILD